MWISGSRCDDRIRSALLSPKSRRGQMTDGVDKRLTVERNVITPCQTNGFGRKSFDQLRAFDPSGQTWNRQTRLPSRPPSKRARHKRWTSLASFSTPTTPNGAVKDHRSQSGEWPPNKWTLDGPSRTARRHQQGRSTSVLSETLTPPGPALRWPISPNSNR